MTRRRPAPSHRLWIAFLVALGIMTSSAAGARMLGDMQGHGIRFALATTQLLTGIIPEQPGIPQSLEIPSLGINAPVEQAGLDAEGAMETPKEWMHTAWYKLGARPGEEGRAVIAGHLDSDTGTAVFWRLKELQPGDEVTVTDDRGVRRLFRVRRKQTFTDETAPLEELFGPSEERELNLITCGGAWDDTSGRYRERLVVFTEYVGKDYP